VSRQSKNRQRLNAILGQIPQAREQLLVAMEDLGPRFDEQTFIRAARSPDARERNRVALIERQYEVLLNWIAELAARALAEGQRLGVVDKAPGHPWERLANLGVISHASAERLQDAKELRDALGHAYPPANWKALHHGVLVLAAELDRYLVRLAAWARAEGILEA
jgi:uncharacterized protein YutE (UPF0331/DUF86 family)